MAAGATYTPIATTTLSVDTATVTFSSIAGTYTDLILVCSVKNDTAASYNMYAQFNSDTGSNYSWTRLQGNGTSAYSDRASGQTVMRYGLFNKTNFVPVIIQFQNYSNATTYKTCISRCSDSSDSVTAIVNLWRSTSAITSIALSVEGGAKYASGSTFTLYGIAAA